MRVELRQLQRKLGITAIYVTHDQEDANAIADSIAVLDQGRIQQIGTPIELYDRPANRFVATFLGTANLIEGTIEPGGRFVAEGFSLPTVGGAPGRACISIRPQDISVGPPDGGIAARIVEREFLGNITRYHTQAGTAVDRGRRPAPSRSDGARRRRDDRPDHRAVADLGVAIEAPRADYGTSSFG